MTRVKPFDLAVVVDDDRDILLAANLLLRDVFEEVVLATSPDEALREIERRSPDAILLDANFARGATNADEGFRWLNEILKRDPDAVVVMITAHAGVQIAVEAMKRGATDFVSKPWSNERLLTIVRTAANLRRSRRMAARTKGAAPPSGIGDSLLLGSSPGVRRVQSLIEKAAPTEANVLILGENGTGKELVARELHRRSRRAAGALVSVDLGAVAENLFDSELFGHVKGAFTDAKGDALGRLRTADRGTLFLDEVGNLPLHLQPKLLTALEQRRVTPVGSSRPAEIDVRVISATNLPPARLGDDRVFRQDLLFRLNTIEIELPPLRDRREDIPELMTHYVQLYEDRYGKPQRALSPPVMAALQGQDWPGNVRALRHAAERAVILAAGDSYAIEDFPLSRPSQPLGGLPPMAAPLAPAEDLNLDRAERQMIERALRKHSYNISLAASELGLTRASLYRRMEKYGL